MYLEPGEQVFPGAVDVQSPAHLFHLVECQLLVSLHVCALPILLLPQTLPFFNVSQAGHELQPVRVETPQRGVPHAEDVFRGCDEMEDLVVSIEDVDDCQPERLVLLRELEMVSMEPRGGPGANLLDVFYGN